MTKRTLVVFVLLLFVTLANCATFQGTLDVDEEARLICIELLSEDGRLLSRVPVHSKTGVYRFDNLATGTYQMNVVGSLSWAYSSHLLHVAGDDVKVENRANPLTIPGDSIMMMNITEFVLKPMGPATMFLSTDAASKGWSITRWHFLQLSAVLFVAAFPKYLKSLDKETLAELTGEVPDVVLDPNEAVKALMGYDEGVEHEILPSIPM